VSEERYVLDASALLGALLYETGADRVSDILDRAVISAVNLSEVIAKLQDKGVPDIEADGYLGAAGVTVIALHEELAIAAGRLRNPTRHVGLSFGDRACLALGRQLGATVLTADRAWAEHDLGVTIEVIR
jgi:ribonuclease VapC